MHRLSEANHMHELSITQGIVESVCEAVPDGKVLAVTVEIGKLSGVVSDSVRFCFDLCAQGSRLEGARLDIVDVPGRGRCGSCQQEMQIGDLVARCPCGNPFLEILRGQELRIRSVEVT
jgi:hydrogenase nickel incorporation protein HypA/HybF